MATYTDFTRGMNLTTSLVDVHANTPASQVRDYTFLSVANVDGTSAATVDLFATNGTESVYLAKTQSVEAGKTVYYVGDERLRLAAGWKLQARASAAAKLDLFCTGSVRS